MFELLDKSNEKEPEITNDTLNCKFYSYLGQMIISFFICVSAVLTCMAFSLLTVKKIQFFQLSKRNRFNFLKLKKLYVIIDRIE